MHKSFITLALKLAIIAGTGYWLLSQFSSDEFEGTNLPAHTRILSFGDSLTQGVGASDGQDYPAQLARILDRTVINSGISGETTAGGRQRFARVLEQHQPSIVVLLEGGNDILRNLPIEQTRNNLAAMIETAQSQGAHVLLVAVPARSLPLNDSVIYEELAEQYQVLLLDRQLSELLGNRRMKSDQIHLNDRGYHALALAIAEKLNEL